MSYPVLTDPSVYIIMSLHTDLWRYQFTLWFGTFKVRSVYCNDKRPVLSYFGTITMQEPTSVIYPLNWMGPVPPVPLKAILRSHYKFRLKNICGPSSITYLTFVKVNVTKITYYGVLNIISELKRFLLLILLIDQNVNNPKSYFKLESWIWSIFK